MSTEKEDPGNVSQSINRFEIKYHHGGISVPDLEASITWFRDVLGFNLERRLVIESVPAKVAMLQRGDLRIELFEVSGSTGASLDRRHPDLDMRTQGNKHVAFAVRDVHAAADELRRRGADIVFVKDFKFGSSAFVRDNAGNLIEFVQQPDLFG